MNLPFRSSLLLTALFLHLFTQGQKLHFERFTVDDGLQNNIVFSAAADAKGLMWFGTSTGIDRFDGNNFVHYSLPLKNNSVTNYLSIPFILADGEKRIWAASAGNIYLYNSRKDAFELPEAVNKLGERSKTITGLYSGSNGRLLLIGTNNSFYVYDPSRERIVSPEGFDAFVRFVFQDNKGVIWVVTNKGISKYILNIEKLSELPFENNVLAQSAKGLVSSISQDLSGRYWIAMLDGRLFVYDEATQSVRPVRLSRLTVRSYAIKDFYHDPATQHTLVSTDGGGLTVLNKDLEIVEVYQSNEDDISSLSNNAVYDIFSDSYKRLWVTTYGGGVNVAAPNVQPFRNFFHETNNPNSLSNNAAKAVTEDIRGHLWFGTRKGISRLDMKSGTWQHFNEETKAPSFTSDNVLALANDDKETIWAGTYGGGLVRIHSGTGSVASYKTTEGDSSSIGTDYVYAVLHDSKGRTWTGGIRGPVSYLDPVAGKFTRITTPVSSVNCITEDSQGRILLGTEKGVYYVSGDSLQNLFPKEVNEKVLCLLEYSPGQYWLGTQGGGVIVVSRAKGVEKTIKTSNGLPSDVIAGIVREPNGDVWIGTSKGIAHYQPASEVIIAYSKADGLAGSQVNYGGVFRTREGEMIFGTTDGFSLFKPENIKTKGYAPNIVLTGLTINNKQVKLGEKDSPLSDQIDETDILRLKYYQNSITIDFVNTSPSLSGKHLYSWKLEGFDKEWSPPSPVASAVYTNLHSGKYNLLIKVFSKGQAENTEIRKLRIVIQSPWWRTPWAYAGYFFLLAATVFGGYNYYGNWSARKKFAERLKLNTSISHEIRTPLTLIKGPVNALVNATGLNESDKSNLELARKNIEKLEGIISQFIDYQKTGLHKMQMQVIKADIVSLIDDITASFLPLMKEKGIHFTYSKPSEPIVLLYDKDKLEKVFNNLLSNAVKYTPSQQDISVEVSRTARDLVVKVKDTGIGIPADQQRFIFSGYFRADNTVNLKETGSGIGLNVARELVDMHKGKIDFTSEAGKGTVFSVRIPLVNDALQQYLVSGQPETTQVVMPGISSKDTRKTVHHKILVAEDNDELREYLKRELETAGYNVFAAANGLLGLDLVRKVHPDLIITDIMMPEMNGFQLCMAVKKDINSCHIPVIMLTAIHDKDYLLEGYRSGADDYVRKPFDLFYMQTRIENLLENRIRFRNKIMSVFEQGSFGQEEDSDITWLRSATEIIVENMPNPEFSVEMLSKKMAMSRPVLFRKFKAITNDSPQHFINQIRLKRAIELLQQKNMHVTDVAYECGFSDPKYFSTVFKKYFGKTPSEYVQSNH